MRPRSVVALLLGGFFFVLWLFAIAPALWLRHRLKKTAPLVLALVVLLPACAPSTDGLRQSCAVANVTLTQATLTGTALYKFGHQELRAQLTKENADETESKAKTYDKAFDKFITDVQTITSVHMTVCAQADAVDAGQRKDVAALMAQVAKIVIDIATVVSELQKTINISTVVITKAVVYGPDHSSVRTRQCSGRACSRV